MNTSLNSKTKPSIYRSETKPSIYRSETKPSIYRSETKQRNIPATSSGSGYSWVFIN